MAQALIERGAAKVYGSTEVLVDDVSHAVKALLPRPVEGLAVPLGA